MQLAFHDFIDFLSFYEYCKWSIFLIFLFIRLFLRSHLFLSFPITGVRAGLIDTNMILISYKTCHQATIAAMSRPVMAIAWVVLQLGWHLYDFIYQYNVDLFHSNCSQRRIPGLGSIAVTEMAWVSTGQWPSHRIISRGVMRSFYQCCDLAARLLELFYCDLHFAMDSFNECLSGRAINSFI